ncbi:DinB family protein [Rubrivirga sp.]|uniref:DinB family protein n=1 Tax=Rubrivirga sp. TaxID=1885344 RepID=UPI003C726B1D
MLSDATWYSPSTRIPRRDQVVRILVDSGVDHEARFVVEHTDDWPSGAWWELTNGRASHPFDRVEQWSPDPSARPPQNEAEPPVPAAHPPTEADKQPPRNTTPAILNETLQEIERTGEVLKLFPTSHYDWSPHPDIASIRVLALRLVRIVARMGWILELETLELMFEPDLPDFAEPDHIAETYAANASTVRDLIPSLTGEHLRQRWTLERNGQVVAAMERGEALRQFGLTPIVYHRGEAAVLMTALGLKAPHPYPLWAFEDGPTAEWQAPPSEA